MEDDIYVGSEGDGEGESEDQIVTDELLDDDAGDYAAEAGDHEVLDENGAEEVAEDDKQQEAEADTNEKPTRKRSRSKSPPASREKDDFDDDELDSDVDETGNY